jgi:hypothetical protein
MFDTVQLHLLGISGGSASSTAHLQFVAAASVSTQRFGTDECGNSARGICTISHAVAPNATGNVSLVFTHALQLKEKSDVSVAPQM